VAYGRSTIGDITSKFNGVDTCVEVACHSATEDDSVQLLYSILHNMNSPPANALAFFKIIMSVVGYLDVPLSFFFSNIPLSS
jgi:hypothetical protein